MIGLGLKNFTRNILMNIFIIIQLAAVIVTCGAFISSAESRFDDYEPFRELLDGDGEIIFIPPGRISCDELAELIPKLHKVQYLDASYTVPADAVLPVPEGHTSHGAPVIRAYDDGLISLYSPQTSQGELTKSRDFSCLSGVGNIGDKLLITLYNTEGKPFEAELTVNGVLKDKGCLLGADKFNTMTVNCREIVSPYYRTIDSERNTDTLIVRAEDIRKADGVLMPDGVGVLRYNAPLTDEERENNASILNSFCAHAAFEKVKENTLDSIRSQLMILIPIATMLVITAVACIVSSTAVKTKRQLRNYAIFMLNGADRRRLFLISLSEMSLCGLLALMLARGLYLMLPLFEVSSGLILKTDILTVSAAMLIVLTAVVSACLMTYAMTRRLTVKEQLYSE
ncbi:MAG: hypothetical protein IKP47_04100 [Ruminococcus sp.]|nr:hypothetical protein [Ruminococcus sp.]